MSSARQLARVAHRREVDRSDVRWLIAWAFGFAVAVAVLLGGYQVYRWTGPHPDVTAAVRWLKHEARWLIPGLKSRPNFRVRPD